MKIIGIIAGKGGVGKSTVALNLARALSTSYSVGLLDGDLYGPSLKQMLGVDQEPTSQLGKILPLEIEKLRVISLSFFKQGEQNNAVRAPIANSIIKQFVHEVEWGALDYLIVDFPPGTGDIPLTLMQQLAFDGALLVSTPQKVSLIDVERAKKMCQAMQVPILGVVENMSHFEGKALFGEGNLEALQLPILVRIPLDPQLACAMDEGKKYESEEFSKLACVIEQFSPEKKVQINQPNPYTLELTYNDGRVDALHASDLQKACPCVRCRNRDPKVDPKVSILDVEPIGRYAMKVHFSSGCSKGIYTIR